MSQDVKPLVKPHIASRQLDLDDEQLSVDPTFEQSNVWSLKIPRFLQEQWERVTEEGMELGTLVVDNNFEPPRISLRLPDTSNANGDDPMNGQARVGPSRRPRYDASVIPDEYDVHVPAERAKNTFIFSESIRTWGPMSRAGGAVTERKKQRAHPKLLARVAHECTAKPVKNQKYLKILGQRQQEAQSSRRPIVQLESTGISKAQQNQLAGGFVTANSAIGKGFVSQSSQNGPREIFARLERAELTNRLFDLFSEKPYWSITALRGSLKQPDIWIREILLEIADQVKEGPYINLWKLKDVWQDVDGYLDGEEGKPDMEGDDDDDDDMEEPDLEEVGF